MTILVVDDDPDVRLDLGRALQKSGDGWDLRFAATAKEALALAASPAVECVVLDYRLPDGDGLTVLRELKRVRPDLAVVMVTGSGSEDIAVDAMKLGAADYVVKHATYAMGVPGRVRLALGRRSLAHLGSASDAPAAARELPALDAATRKRFEADGFVTRSPAMFRVLDWIDRLLVCADPGTRLQPTALKAEIANEQADNPATGAPLRAVMRQLETAVISDRLREHNYRRDLTAQSLGIRRESLWKKLRDLGLARSGSDADDED